MEKPTAERLSPPVAPREPKVTEVHGDKLVDDYAWLRDRDDPRVRKYLEAENEYTTAIMKPTEPLQATLYEEMVGRIKETDVSAMVPHGAFEYYTRTEAAKEYSIRCRRRLGSEEEQVLFDGNAMATGHDYFHFTWGVSLDHRLGAFAVDTNGGERYVLRFRDLETRKDLPDRIENVDDFAWAADHKTLFYAVLDDAMRSFQIKRHRLGDDSGRDDVVFTEADPAFYLSLSTSRSGKFVVIESNSKVTSEIWVIPADKPEEAPRVIEKRRDDVEYRISHAGKRFYIVTNDGATNFKLVAAPVDKPGRENWREVIGHRDDVLLSSVAAFSDHLVASEREGGFKQLVVYDLDGKSPRRVPTPDPVYTIAMGSNPNFATHQVRFSYTSLVAPPSSYDFDLDTGELHLRKQAEIKGYDPSKFESERFDAVASDGRRVPISIVRKKGASGPQPLLLNGYGAYGSPAEPRFSSARVSLLERGVGYAIAHVRGGSELGRGWYEDGKKLHKRNSFNDFIVSAEALIKRGHTTPKQLAITGASAGGLLMGAVTNMRPDLFGAVVADVPFVDVINTMLDPTLPLTVLEYDEWGDPNEERYYRYIASYSPYENIAAQEYPNMLLLGGWTDPRVGYWEPAKFAARLRATKTDGNTLLLKTNLDSGHGGPTGRYVVFKEYAFAYSFVLRYIGVAE